MTFAVVLGAAVPAVAQEGDDEVEPAAETDPTGEPDGTAADDAPEDDGDAAGEGVPFAEAEADAAVAAGAAQWGVGLRLRRVFVPKGMIELFLAEAASGMGHNGIGLEATRRKGEFELSFGLEYESLSPATGYYREKGEGSVSERTDFTEFDGFGWVTLDATFVFHKVLKDKFALRYGAGFGLGILVGEIRRTDAACTSDDIQNDCVPAPGGQVDDDVPPIFPVVNLLVGGQYRHNDKLSFNLELGLRTVFYTGIGATYYF